MLNDDQRPTKHGYLINGKWMANDSMISENRESWIIIISFYMFKALVTMNSGEWQLMINNPTIISNSRMIGLFASHGS